jgi:peptidoglycan/xylan/chitin deacetylase (PgdA/CDA1 family)
MAAREISAVTSTARAGTTRRTTRRGRWVTNVAGRPPLLMYHAVGHVTDDPFSLYVTPERFDRQMAMLAGLGLRGVSLAELGDAMVCGQAAGMVAITFDDGYRDVLSHALPALRRHHFAATFFAVSGLLGATNAWDPPPRRELMTVADLRALDAEGHEIGSHSVSHARLAGLGVGALRHEVQDSRRTLAQVIGKPPRTFCYPYGSVDAAAVRAVVYAGYSYACAVRRVPGLATLSALPRVGVVQRDWNARLTAKLFLRGR